MSPSFAPVSMNAAITRVYAVIASWTPWMVVSRSATIWEIDTFMTLLSSTITNWAAPRIASADQPAAAGPAGDAGSDLTARTARSCGSRVLSAMTRAGVPRGCGHARRPAAADRTEHATGALLQGDLLDRAAGAVRDSQGEPCPLEPADALAADGVELQPDGNRAGGLHRAPAGGHDDRLAAAPDALRRDRAPNGDLPWTADLDLDRDAARAGQRLHRDLRRELDGGRRERGARSRRPGPAGDRRRRRARRRR